LMERELRFTAIEYDRIHRGTNQKMAAGRIKKTDGHPFSS